MSCKDNSIINPNAVQVNHLVEVRGVPGDIVFKKTLEGNTTVFTGSTYKLFDIQLISSPSLVEVGSESLDVTIEGKIVEKGTSITNRTILPSVPAIEPIVSNNFSFIVNDVGSDDIGTFPSYKLEATDSFGNKKSVIGGTKFYSKIYQGYSSAESLSASEIKALQNLEVAESILDIYGGINTYTFPVSALKNYGYWVFDKETVPIAGARLGLVTFPLVELPTVMIESSIKPGLIREFRVIRTANSFGSGSFDIELLKQTDFSSLDDIDFIAVE